MSEFLLVLCLVLQAFNFTFVLFLYSFSPTTDDVRRLALFFEEDLRKLKQHLGVKELE